ncbi:ABC transporter permease [Parapusillimonas granuli]|uniref:ABC transporter permease n=1 Tax=Parapusillimonas granuli TaxID=380911 RepID=A0A853G3P3_9BURK|nr:ABC transporter permease [Parapusillimonas granuli]MBB5214455.1 ABC-2 type transport system permease protein [Parapusillimonas granuli]MEB2398293.1 ABC transporter permease [Alcaligenaceae bacterium]NYT49136.1 ABC transporter permease [Parapusillimonas granuli]
MKLKSMATIWRLGIKELWSLWRDPVMLALIAFSFTVSVYTAATAVPETLHHVSIAIVDEDHSPLSQQITAAFYPPQFIAPAMISHREVDPGMDIGRYSFVLNIPPNFQRDLLAGRNAEIQINVDATRMSQAFTGNGNIQQIIQGEIDTFLRERNPVQAAPVDLVLRARFNPGLEKAWFGGLMEIINQITMLSIILTGAALIREREHGTIEHLLVMPVTPLQIMLSKVWSMSLVVLAAAALSLNGIVRGLLHVPIDGSLPLFFCGAALHLFAMTSMGTYLATLARNMPQFGMLMMLILLPLQMLSGGTTPRESMPAPVQDLMLAAPTTHFVELGQAILYRGAGFDVVWPSFLSLLIIGSIMFALSLRRFRSAINSMA